MMTYTMDIAGLKRDLPLCPVSDDLYIGAFVMFGDVEMTIHAAKELLKRAPGLTTSSRPKPRRSRSRTKCPASAVFPICSPARRPRRT